MSDDTTKDTLRSLVEEAVTHAQGMGKDIDFFRHRAPLLDSEFDDQFIRLNSFGGAIRRVAAIPEVTRVYGVERAESLVQQFLYAYFDSVPQLDFNAPCFEAVCLRFRQELATSEWRYVGVMILTNFASTLGRIEIADGIAVCLRTLEQMQDAVGQEELEWLKEDWMQGSVGSHALLVQHREPKNADNIFLKNSAETYIMAHRSLLALRLLKGGDVMTGRLFYSRPALVPSRLSGRLSSGNGAEWRPGREYRLDEADLPLLRDYYELLRRFERSHSNSWKNVTIALRRFMAV